MSYSVEFYTGTYSIGNETTIKLTKDGNSFYGEIKGVGKVKIYPESNTHFFLRDLDIQLEFKSSSEVANNFTLIQNGVKHLATRKQS